MKTFSLLALITLLCGCSSPRPDSTHDIRQFYLSRMATFADVPDTPPTPSPLMQQYVAKELMSRLMLIESLYEQEIVGSDYFMYVQDYAPQWALQFRVGKPQPFLGGEKVDVQLGTDSTPLHLEVYTRWEDDRWKIYRVRDVSDNVEHPVYSAGALTQAQRWSALIAPEYQKMK